LCSEIRHCAKRQNDATKREKYLKTSWGKRYLKSRLTNYLTGVNMALYYELQVFKDVYTLVQKVFLYTQEFPREYKYTLGQDMKRDAIQLVRSIYRANKAKDKVVYLETFLDDFELLKFEIRLCVDMKILAIKKQAELSGLMDSIGKQITGWRNANR